MPAYTPEAEAEVVKLGPLRGQPGTPEGSASTGGEELPPLRLCHLGQIVTPPKLDRLDDKHLSEPLTSQQRAVAGKSSVVLMIAPHVERTGSTREPVIPSVV